LLAHEPATTDRLLEENTMKKTYWMLIILLIPFITCGFFQKRQPEILPGVYSIKLRNLTLFDLVSKDIESVYKLNLAELTEAKPEDLEVDVDYQKMWEVRFGYFKLGNNDQKTWFFMGKDQDGYWSEFYIDQNLDHRIEKKERIKGFQTGQDFVTHKVKRMQALSFVPVSLKVSYKGLTFEFEKNLYFFIITSIYQKKELTDNVVGVISASFFEGEFKALIDGNPKQIKFRIMDTNSNGCFNDYGTDQLFIDRNNDGFFRKNESYPLTEYLVSGSDKKQRSRLIALPFPAKIAVVEAQQEYDLSSLEPIPEPVNTKPEASPPPAPQSAESKM
jgi:hypothetical protein